MRTRVLSSIFIQLHILFNRINDKCVNRSIHIYAYIRIVQAAHSKRNSI